MFFVYPVGITDCLKIPGCLQGDLDAHFLQPQHHPHQCDRVNQEVCDKLGLWDERCPKKGETSRLYNWWGKVLVRGRRLLRLYKVVRIAPAGIQYVSAKPREQAARLPLRRRMSL